jgi:hypothetical protein
MISLTGRGHRDILGAINGGGDGFKDSSHKHEKSLYRYVSGGAIFWAVTGLSFEMKRGECLGCPAIIQGLTDCWK